MTRPGSLRPLLSDKSGEMVVAAGGWEALGQSCRSLLPIDRWIPLPEGSTLMHLPDRPGLARRRSTGEIGRIPGEHTLAVAAVLPVGYLRLQLPAHQRCPDRPPRTLPLYGYTAVADRGGEIVVAAQRSDDFAPWTGPRPGPSAVAAEVGRLQRQMPRSRVVAQLSICALEHNCLTAQNTFLGSGEGALPTSAACNADCLGCISLQTDSGAPAAQPRMNRAPTAQDLLAVGTQHLKRAQSAGESGMVSFGQGCEGEPLLRERQLLEVAVELRAGFPGATIHINTNGSRPESLRRLMEAGVNSCRISVFSFGQELFEAYYRPRGYTIQEVLASCRVAAEMGAQLTINLLTFPGVSDSPGEAAQTVQRLRELEVGQLQLRSLNVDPLWLLDRIPELPTGIGMDRLVDLIKSSVPRLAMGNFTRPLASAVAL
ncbi:MAG: radical SAM protein [Candidatus Dormibacteria bacterium]